MARKCNICQHGRVKEINIRLLNMGRTNETFAAIASGYEHVNTQALRNHFYKHLDGKAATNQEGRSTPAGVPGMDDLDGMPEVDLMQKEKALWDMFDTYTKAGDAANALRCSEGALKCMQARDRRSDEGRDKSEVHLQDSDEWLKLRTVLLRTLEKWPDCLQAVMKALEGMEL